jgi:hypothetical protein
LHASGLFDYCVHIVFPYCSQTADGDGVATVLELCHPDCGLSENLFWLSVMLHIPHAILTAPADGAERWEFCVHLLDGNATGDYIGVVGLVV